MNKPRQCPPLRRNPGPPSSDILKHQKATPVFYAAVAGGSHYAYCAGVQALAEAGLQADFFNPAAVGIFVSTRVKKCPQAFTFMATYLLRVPAMAYFHLGLASATPADALSEPFINSALFVGFFMVTDPPTSPGTTPEQVVFSIITDIVSVGIFITFGGLTYLLVGLWAGNAFTAALTQMKKSTEVETPNRASASSGA